MMTQDEIIELVRQAGFDISDHGRSAEQVKRMMTRFGQLVAEAAASKEREACAKVCEWYSNSKRANVNYSEECAQAIRARSEATSRGEA